MPAKSRKLSPAEIATFEASRDLGAEILQSIKDMKAGRGITVVTGHSRNDEANNASAGLTLADAIHGRATARTDECARNDL